MDFLLIVNFCVLIIFLLGLYLKDLPIFKFQATITNVENDGHIYLQDPNIGLGSLSSLNQQMEAVYLLSKPKWQDLDWYIGKFLTALTILENMKCPSVFQ